MHYHIKNDKLVRVTGNEDDPLWRGKICPKSQFLLQLHNSPERLTTPLKRLGKRGEGKFEPISWDQALDEIAAKLQGVKMNLDRNRTRTGTLTRRGYIRSQCTPNFGDTEAFCSPGVFSSHLAAVAIPKVLGVRRSMFILVIIRHPPVHFGMINNWRLKNNAKMVVPRMTPRPKPINGWRSARVPIWLWHWHLPTIFLRVIYMTSGFVMIAGWQEWRDFLFEKNYSPDWAALLLGLRHMRSGHLPRKLPGRMDACYLRHAASINIAMAGRPIVP